jgi:hypothetical protein
MQEIIKFRAEINKLKQKKKKKTPINQPTNQPNKTIQRIKEIKKLSAGSLRKSTR